MTGGKYPIPGMEQRQEDEEKNLGPVCADL